MPPQVPRRILDQHQGDVTEALLDEHAMDLADISEQLVKRFLRQNAPL